MENNSDIIGIKRTFSEMQNKNTQDENQTYEGDEGS